MFFKIMTLSLSLFIGFTLTGCSSEESSSVVVREPPGCPEKDVNKDYVGCWDSQYCWHLDLSGDPSEPDQWRIARYYSTANGKLYDFTWAYHNSNCAGDVVVYDDGSQIRLETFTDLGIETIPATGNSGHHLVINYNSSTTVDVLTEIKPITGELCFSSNLNVSNSPGFANQDATEVDYTNCLNPLN